MSGIDEDNGNGVRYRAMDEMSVSDDDDENDDTDGPRKKRARSDAKAADGNSVPQWSNPDPYTALPPPDESQRKKKDVVKLIRKARVTDGGDGSTKAGAVNDDFISFDFDDDVVDEPKHTFFDRGEPVPTSGVPINTPTGPRASAQQTREDHPQGPVAPESLPSTKPDPVKISMRKQLPDKPMRNAAIDLSSDPALGNRKRTYQDEIKLEAPRELNNSFGGRKAPSHGGVVSTWQPLPGTNSTPWIELDHSSSANMGLW
jgi:non-canonical poly(A) RNA polymerase PAPD5/7